MEGIWMCIVGAFVAGCGIRFERLPRGAVWFTLFRPEGEPLPPKLVMLSKRWMVGSGAATLICAAVGMAVKNFWLELPVPLVILLACVLALYVIWLRGTSKTLRMIVWPALAITLGVVGYSMLSGLGETKIELGDEGVEIEGMYSLAIPYARIERVELSDTEPATTLRTNGFSLNGIRKGYFRLEDGQRCFLSTDAGVSEYLYIYRTSDGPVVVNLRSEAETVHFYRDLKTRLQK